MSFSDTIFLFFLALILFGPKKLPEMAKKAGRLMAELRRASNEFKSQIETEIAHLPRLCLTFNRVHFGFLRLLIDRVNEE